MKANFRHIVAGIVLSTSMVLSARAAHARDDRWGSEPQLGDAELAGERGGFTVAGLDVQFGAEIRSYLGDRLVMQTNISWTDAGGNVVNSYSAALASTSADALRTQLVTGSGITFSVGNESVVLANAGQTAFIQRSSGNIQNIIINTASNVNLSQIIDARVDISGYSLFQTGVISGRIGSALASMGAIALLSSQRN